jgi:hypothetical protein
MNLAVAWSSNPFEFCHQLTFTSPCLLSTYTTLHPVQNHLAYRLQQFKEAIIRNSPYKTPPEVPWKNQYIPETESESESQSPLRQPQAKIFRNGKLQFHQTYKGPVPRNYVNTGVFDGGSNDYYENYTGVDLRWASSLDLIMKHHGIVRYAFIKWFSTALYTRLGWRSKNEHGNHVILCTE